MAWSENAWSFNSDPKNAGKFTSVVSSGQQAYLYIPAGAIAGDASLPLRVNGAAHFALCPNYDDGRFTVRDTKIEVYMQHAIGDSSSPNISNEWSTLFLTDQSGASEIMDFTYRGAGRIRVEIETAPFSKDCGFAVFVL
jgi:hypothetical protein